ncbi:MAG: hypothetical protein AB7D02_01980 [Candidatus Paceibacterota bacterium]
MKIFFLQRIFLKYFKYFSLFLLFPLLVFSAGLVPCGGEGEKECSLCDLLEMIQNILDLLFTRIFPWIIIIMFFYGGFLWMFSGGRQEMIERGQRTIVYAIIGFAIALCAFIIVHTLFWILANVFGGEDFTGTWFHIECED